MLTFFLRRSSQDKDMRLLIRKKSRFCEEAEGAKLIRLNTDTLWFEFVEDEVNESEHIYTQSSGEASINKSDGKDKQIAHLLHTGIAWRQISSQLGVSSKRIAKVKAMLSAFPLSSDESKVIED